MTADEFNQNLQTIGWSPKCLARMLGINDRNPRRWCSGQQEIPYSIFHWVAALANLYRACPPPPRGERG